MTPKSYYRRSRDALEQVASGLKEIFFTFCNSQANQVVLFTETAKKVGLEVWPLKLLCRDWFDNLDILSILISTSGKGELSL